MRRKLITQQDFYSVCIKKAVRWKDFHTEEKSNNIMSHCKFPQVLMSRGEFWLKYSGSCLMDANILSSLWQYWGGLIGSPTVFRGDVTVWWTCMCCLPLLVALWAEAHAEKSHGSPPWRFEYGFWGSLQGLSVRASCCEAGSIRRTLMQNKFRETLRGQWQHHYESGFSVSHSWSLPATTG